jgi:hypothetical protein
MKCHSERSEESRSASSGSVNRDRGEIPRGVYRERQSEILRSAQNDRRRARNDRQFQSSAPLDGGKCVLAREYDPDGYVLESF